MTEPMSSQRSVRYLAVIVGLTGVLLCVSSEADAKSSSAPSNTAAKATACDYHYHPTITTVTPTHAKPGQKITIIGKNFGAKGCFHSVSFGSKSTDAFTYVSPTTVEATVPNLLPGSVPVTVSTEAGMSQFKLEVQAQ
jgi:IPT/TIG domain-containing protein